MRRHLFLALLCLVGLLSFIDRQIITILVVPIKAEFEVSDTAMGALTGIIFSGCYALAAIPLARLADRYPRRNVIAACAALWSVLTSVGGLATSFAMLAASRVGVAVAEAGASPASHSLVADLYPVQQRGTALGILSGAQAIGIGLGVFLGSVLLATFDWRTSFLVVGIPGVLIALLMLTMREPARGMSDPVTLAADQPTLGDTLIELWRIPTYRYLFLAVTCAGFCGYGTLAWGPTFLIRVHHMPVQLIGIWFGLSVAVSLVIGNILWGIIADRWGRRDLRAYLWLGGAGPILSLVPGLGFAFAPNWPIAIACLFAMQLLLTAHIPTCYSLCQTLVRPRIRAMSAVIAGMGAGVLGSGLAPVVVGRINDWLQPSLGVDANRYAIAVAISFAGLAGLFALLGARHVRTDYAATHAPVSLFA